MSSDHIVGFVLGLSAGVLLDAYLKLAEEAIAPARKRAEGDKEPETTPVDVPPPRAASAVA